MAETLSSALRRYGIGTHPLEWRIPPIETYPRVVAFAQTLAGKLVLFALAAVLLRFLADGPWIPVTIAAAAVSYAGRHCHFAALLATGALLGLAPDWFEYRAVYQIAEQQGLIDSLRLGYVRAGTLLACVPLTVAVLWLARRYRDHPLPLFFTCGGPLTNLAAALRIEPAIAQRMTVADAAAEQMCRPWG